MIFEIMSKILIIFAVFSKKKVWSLQNILQTLKKSQALIVHSEILIGLPKVRKTNSKNMPVSISIWNFAGHWADCPTWEEKIRIHSLEIKKGSTTLQHAYKLYTRTLSAMSKPCTVVNSWNDHHRHFWN